MKPQMDADKRRLKQDLQDLQDKIHFLSSREAYFIRENPWFHFLKNLYVSVSR
jgi:hypothetical protein